MFRKVCFALYYLNCAMFGINLGMAVSSKDPSWLAYAALSLVAAIIVYPRRNS